MPRFLDRAVEMVEKAVCLSKSLNFNSESNDGDTDYADDN